MQKYILHVDMNAYFASVAEILYPQYKGKPIVIGSDTSRGIVSTASYEARKYGIHSAMPIYKAKQLCKNLIICDVEWEKYEKFTFLFTEIIKRYSKIIEMFSIDECFVDVSNRCNSFDDAENLAKRIQYEIYNELSLPCSIGVSYNKFLAKLGSDIKKPLGITVINQNDIKKIIWPLDIGDAFGIGKKSAEKLREIGILTLGDLAKTTNINNISPILGKNSQYFIDLVNGIGDSIVNNKLYVNKSVGHSRTFEYDTNDKEKIVRMINKLCKMTSDRAKDDYLVGDNITLTIKYKDFSNRNKSVKLKEYTNSYDTMFNVVLKLFDEIYNDEMIRLVGVSLKNTKKISEVRGQMSIDDIDNKNNSTLEFIESLNKKMGSKVFKTAREIK